MLLSEFNMWIFWIKNYILPPHYVSKSKKEAILAKMLNDYRHLYPDQESIPFTWIKGELKERYGIQPKSISNFFVGILDKYELFGVIRIELSV